MSYNGLLHQTCTIQTKTEDCTTNGDGTIAETWANTYTSVKCRKVQMSSSLLESIKGYNIEADYLFFFRIGQSISLGDRIIESSETYIVKRINQAQGMSGTHHVEVFAKRMDI